MTEVDYGRETNAGATSATCGMSGRAGDPFSGTQGVLSVAVG